MRLLSCPKLPSLRCSRLFLLPALQSLSCGLLLLLARDNGRSALPIRPAHSLDWLIPRSHIGRAAPGAALLR
jgi:hypothetical protein